MAHPRKTLKERLLSILAANTTYLGVATNRMFSDRTREIPTAWMPALNLSIEGESAELQYDSRYRRYKRTADLVIHCLVHATTDAEDAVDDLAHKIETVLYRNDSDPPPLGDQKFDLVYKGSDINIKDEGGRPIGEIFLRWDLIYETIPEYTPITEDLDTADITYEMESHLGGDALEPADEIDFTS